MSFNELAGSPVEAISESGGTTATRRFLVPWPTRFSFVESFVGTGYPSMPQCRMNSIAIQPWNEDMVPVGTIIDPSLQTATYPGSPALITVSYGPDFTKKTWPAGFTRPQVRYGTELRYRISGSAQFLVLPFGGCKWQDTNADVTENSNTRILIPIREIELQWDFVDNPPLDRLDGFMGRVNAETFLGSPPETILFENYSIEESFRASVTNPHTNRVTIQLRRRRIVTSGVFGDSNAGWNHDYREDPAGWAKMVFKSDGQPRYPTTSFADMFA